MAAMLQKGHAGDDMVIADVSCRPSNIEFGQGNDLRRFHLNVCEWIGTFQGELEWLAGLSGAGLKSR